MEQIVRQGKCLHVRSDGIPHTVRVDEGNMMTNDIDISLYVARGIQPPWQLLSPCDGQPPICVEVIKEMEAFAQEYGEMQEDYPPKDK